MMNGSRPENFPSQIFFGKYRQNGRAGSGEKRKGDNRQNRHSVGKKRHGRQSRRQAQNSRLAHIKSSRRNVKPKESQRPSHHYPAKSAANIPPETPSSPSITPPVKIAAITNTKNWMKNIPRTISPKNGI